MDGVVWQPYSGTSSTSADTPNKVEHEGTFSAFGYVKQFERELNPSGSTVDSPYSQAFLTPAAAAAKKIKLVEKLREALSSL